MTDFELWLYRGLIAGLLAVVWYFLRGGFASIRKDIKDLTTEIRAVTGQNAVFTEKFAVNAAKFEEIDKRLNTLEERFRNMELSHFSCKNRENE